MRNKFQELLSDKRIAEAKKLIQEALSEFQNETPKESVQLDRQPSGEYQALLEQINSQRGGQLFYPYLGSGFGKGALVELVDGSYKYDFITGIGVHFLGHSHLGLINELIDGAISNTVMQGHLQQNENSAELIKLMLEISNETGGNFNSCFLTSSGVMANENALKIAFQKRAPATRVLAFHKCFHGRTMSVSQITDKELYRKGLPKTLHVDYIPFYDEKNPEQSTQEALKQLKHHLESHPGEYGAMIMELIQGEAGSYPGSKSFFKTLIAELKKHNVSVIADEVQSFGRTTRFFAFQYFELDQDIDIVTIGKMSQTCATFFREDHRPQPGLISQTFTSSSSAINASLYALRFLKDNGFYGEDGKIAQLSTHFRNRLKEIHSKHPDHLEGPYGVGAMVAMTIAKGDAEMSKAFIKKLFQNGVMAFTAGAAPTRVRFLMPAGAVTQEDINKVCEIIEHTLLEVAK